MSVIPSKFPIKLSKRVELIRQGDWRNSSKQNAFHGILNTAISMTKRYQELYGHKDELSKEIGALKNKVKSLFDELKDNPRFNFDSNVFSAACDFLVIGYILDAWKLLDRSIVRI